MVQPVVSPRIRELIRQGAQYALDPPQVWRDEVDDAVFAGSEGQRIVDDPELAAAARRVIISTLSYWVRANYLAPGDPVPTEVSDAPLTMARDLVRRGMDDTALDAYRVGQSVAWRHWMEIAFELTSDQDELRELLDVTSRSIAAFVDATVEEVRTHMRAERQQLTGDVQAERREVVALVLQGAPITAARAQARLGYRLDHPHYACVIWSDAVEPDIGVLGDVVDALTPPGRGTHSLTVAASTGTRWTWATTAPALDAAADILRAAPEVRVALAGPGPGLAGFRRAHLDALATQRLMSRLGPQRQTAGWGEVALVSLAGQDREAATRFVADTLGELARADPDLRDTLRMYLTHGCSIAAAAAATFTHRNTFLRRLKRAQSLLPEPRGHNTELGVALELSYWNIAGGS